MEARIPRPKSSSFTQECTPIDWDQVQWDLAHDLSDSPVGRASLGGRPSTPVNAVEVSNTVTLTHLLVFVAPNTVDQTPALGRGAIGNHI